MAVFNFGERNFIGSWKRSTQLNSDGYPKAKPGGAEFDWSTVTALVKDTYLEDQLDVNRDPQGAEASGPFAAADCTVLNAITFANSKPASDEFPIKAGMKVLRYGTPIQRRASDGKFVLALTGGPKTRGDIYLVNETVVFDPSKSATDQLDPKSLYPIAIDGGRVFKERLLYATHDVIGIDVDGADVSAGVTLTLAELEAALPEITYAID
jgi:hypothetical protein